MRGIARAKGWVDFGHDAETTFVPNATDMGQSLTGELSQEGAHLLGHSATGFVARDQLDGLRTNRA